MLFTLEKLTNPILRKFGKNGPFSMQSWSYIETEIGLLKP